MVKINPFKPNSPVPPGMFVGRLDELERLEAQLFQTKAGQPTNFSLTGERGIGKSSLLLYLTALAEGKINIETIRLNFLVIDAFLDQKTTQLGLVKKIEIDLRNKLAKTESARKFFADTWDFLKRIEIAGVKISNDKIKDLDETHFEEFVYSFAD